MCLFLLQSTFLLVLSTTLIQANHDCYQLNRMPILGAEIHGLDLRQNLTDECFQQLKNDTHTYQLLVVRKQKVITIPRQLQIARWFGEPLDVYNNNHPKAQSKHVFRVSNNPHEGFFQVGIYGWHVDGFRKPYLHRYVTYYMESVADTGDTVFMDAYQVISGLSPERKALWDKLFVRPYVPPDHPFVNPLLYQHPITGKETICINMEFTLNFEEELNATHRVVYGRAKTNEIRQQIVEETRKYQDKFYSHKWQGGDFIITDNPSLLHRADRHALHNPQVIGLRVLNRVSVSGIKRPTRKKDLLNMAANNGTSKDDDIKAESQHVTEEDEEDVTVEDVSDGYVDMEQDNKDTDENNNGDPVVASDRYSIVPPKMNEDVIIDTRNIENSDHMIDEL